jgi:hypothetical protein
MIPWSAWCAAAIEQKGALTNAGPGRDVSNEKEVDAPIDAITIDSQPFTPASGESSPNALMRACTRRGFEARRSSASRPRRVATPVPQPSTKTSLRSTSARARARPSSVVRSTSRLRWPRAQNDQAGCRRSRDPPGGSSSHTSAPASASTWPTTAVGSALAEVTTRRPEQGSTWCIPALCQ